MAQKYIAINFDDWSTGYSTYASSAVYYFPKDVRGFAIRTDYSGSDYGLQFSTNHTSFNEYAQRFNLTYMGGRYCDTGIYDKPIKNLPTIDIDGVEYYYYSWKNQTASYWPWLPTGQTSSIELYKTYVKFIVDVNFEAEPDSISFSKFGQAETITINGGEWTATSKPDWVTLSELTGEDGDSTVATAERNDTATRTGKIVFTDANGEVAEVNVSQKHIVQLVPIGAMRFKNNVVKKIGDKNKLIVNDNIVYQSLGN